MKRCRFIRKPFDPKGWVDIGCDNLEQAARNREIVAKKLYIDYYLQLERELTTYPVGILLPERLIGHIPQVGGEGARHEPPVRIAEEDEEETIYGG